MLHMCPGVHTPYGLPELSFGVANFRETPQGEVRRTGRQGTWVNMGKKRAAPVVTGENGAAGGSVAEAASPLLPPHPRVL